MSRFPRTIILLAAIFALPTGGFAENMASASDKLGIGRPALQQEMDAWDLDVRPDGVGLPLGKGTVAEGEAIYSEICAACHGDFGEGVDRWAAVAGGEDSLTDERPVKTIGSYWPYLSTVYDYVRRAMPYGDARSLSDNDVYAITAYLLYLNDLVTEEDFELSNKNFSSFVLPNKTNFISDNRKQENHVLENSKPCMKNCMIGKPKILSRARALDVTPTDKEGE